MKIETEFKYLIDKLPLIKEKQQIIQVYFSLNDNTLTKLKSIIDIDYTNIVTFRIRKIKTDKTLYILTLKEKGTISRVEIETEITKEDFDFLNKYKEKEIIKNRYIDYVNGFKFEFDEYLNLQNNIITVEIETDNIENKNQIENILINNYNLKIVDVTNDINYKNQFLKVRI